MEDGKNKDLYIDDLKVFYDEGSPEKITFENYGFDGIAVALIGGNTGLGSLFSGMLLAALKAAQPIMDGQGIPNAIAVIISASIIVFVAMKTGLIEMIQKLRRAK